MTASMDNRHPRQSPILLSVGHGHLCKQAPAAAASKQKTLVEQSPELLAGKCPALHLGSVGCRALWGLGIQHQLSCGGWEGELGHPGGHEGFEQGRDSPSSPFSKTEASSPVGGCGVHVRRCSCCLESESPPVGPTGFRAGDGGRGGLASKEKEARASGENGGQNSKGGLVASAREELRIQH